MVQRIGRTGRKRNGNVIFLMNEGSRFDFSSEKDDKNNYYENYADNFLQSNMRYFEMFKNPIKMIPDHLEIIYKKIDENTNNDSFDDAFKNNDVKSPFLNNEEKCYLNTKFGSFIKYKQINYYPFNELIFDGHASDESKILLSSFKYRPEIIAKKGIFDISSENEDDEKSESFSEDSSSPSFSPVYQPEEVSFLDKKISKKRKEKDPDSPDGFSQVIKRRTQIWAPIFDGKSGCLSSKKSLDDDSSDDENNIFVMESESFISASSECLCSESDEYSDEVMKSPTFILIKKY
mgnify:CR=1 FL=1